MSIYVRTLILYVHTDPWVSELVDHFTWAVPGDVQRREPGTPRQSFSVRRGPGREFDYERELHRLIGRCLRTRFGCRADTRLAAASKAEGDGRVLCVRMRSTLTQWRAWYVHTGQCRQCKQVGHPRMALVFRDKAGMAQCTANSMRPLW